MSRESRCEPVERRGGLVPAPGEPRRILAERRHVDADAAFGPAACAERGIRLADRTEGRFAELDDARAPRAPLGGGVVLGVVESLLQQERLAEACPRRLESVANVASGRRTELRLGERDLAVGLAHGGVGLHDERLRPHLEIAARLEGGTFTSSPSLRNPTTPPKRAASAVPKTTREGNHQSASAMAGV